MTAFIYEIKNAHNLKRYVGSTINVERRFLDHKRDLENEMHFNQYLQRAWNKYGPDSFKFNILRKVKSEFILEEEQKEIDKMLLESGEIDKDISYNLSNSAYRPSGTPLKLADFEVSNIIQRYIDGEPPYKICEDYDVHATTIFGYLKRENIETRSYREAFGGCNDQEISEICEKYLNGVKGTLLAKEYGVDPSTIYDYLDKNNIKRRSQTKSRELIAKVIEMYQNGATIAAISRKLPISRPTVRKYVKGKK